MVAALPAPSIGAVPVHWSAQPIALITAVLLVAGYVAGVRRLARTGRRWPVGRTLTFALGIALYVWTTCGFLEVYHRALFWVWVVQTLLLFLVVPLVVLAGGPLHLARACWGADGWPDRLLRTGPARVLANPLVGPALVPLLSGVLFFGPLPRWAIETSVAGWALQLALVVLGALIALPLAGVDEARSSLAVGLSLAIGMLELVLDALPGAVLRLHTTPATSYFEARASYPWTPSWLRDQQTGGSIVWVLAEVIDLPFLVLVFYRWLRVDARDAAEVDAVLEAERIARLGTGAEDVESGHGPAEAPWWLSDPAMRRRFGRGD
jgi:cytochrome c oxidase assembly factor CtaG